MSEKLTPLRQQMDRVHISLARRPEGLRGGVQVNYLPPRLWEELRLQLQAEYRRATGEPDALLLVSDRTDP